MKCLNHPDVAAKWRCTACGRVFCETCVKMLGGRAEQVAVCPACGERCEEAIPSEEAAISQEPSFWQRLPGIARKVSFGFQPNAGAKTREILMSILFTLKQRSRDFRIRLTNAHDHLSENPTLDS